MNQTIKNLTLAISLMLPAMFSYATSMIFETVTSSVSGKSSDQTYAYNRVSGIEKDTGNTITATFGHGSGSYNTSQQICGPLVLTAMEKPGRYYLIVFWDENNLYQQIIQCELRLKIEPS